MHADLRLRSGDVVVLHYKDQSIKVPSAAQHATGTPLCTACFLGLRPGRQPGTAHFWCQPYSKVSMAQRCSRCGQCADRLGLFHPIVLDCYSGCDQQPEQESQHAWRKLTTPNNNSRKGGRNSSCCKTGSTSLLQGEGFSSSTGTSSWGRQAVTVSPPIAPAGTAMTVAEVHLAALKLLQKGAITLQDAEQIVTAALTGASSSNSPRAKYHEEVHDTGGSPEKDTGVCGPSTAKPTPQEAAKQAAADPGLMGYLLCCFTGLCS